MRDDCRNTLWKGKPLAGRKIDLCEGRGFDGRQNPLQQDSDRFRAAIGLDPVVVAEPQAIQMAPRKSRPIVKAVSKIGTRLSKIFHDKWGAIPCGDCKAAILELNGLTVEQVQADRERWVKSITGNATKAATYWQKIAIAADQFLNLGGTEYVIGQCLDEACQSECTGGSCCAK